MSWIWILVAVCAILSVVLLFGKGSFLIAGYNMLSKERKAQYDEKRLCRVVGGGLGVITVILGTAALFDFELPSALSWMIPWGLFATIAVVMVLAETVCKATNTR